MKSITTAFPAIIVFLLVLAYIRLESEAEKTRNELQATKLELAARNETADSLFAELSSKDSLVERLREINQNQYENCKGGWK